MHLEKSRITFHHGEAPRTYPVAVAHEQTEVEIILAPVLLLHLLLLELLEHI